MNETNKILKLHERLITSKQFIFPKSGQINVNANQGVYIVYSPSNKVLHVGTTKRAKGGLNQRLYNHLTGSSSFYNKYLKKKNISLRNGYKYKYIEVKDSRKRALLEALSIGLLCPKHIGTGEKRETKTYNK